MSARPFQVGDEVLVDGEPGVIAEMRDGPGWIPSTYTLVEMTGLPFPAWDAVALSPDRTRMVGSRQIELVRPAPTGRISSQAGLASIRHGVVRPDDTAAAVVTAALAWEESYDQSSGTHSAIRTGQLMGAVHAHRAALGGAS